VAEHASLTALKIARFMVLIDAVPRLRPLLPDGAAEAAAQILRASGATSEWRIDLMRRPSTLRFYRVVERMLGRGQLAWFGVRKRWMADQVEAALADGARQLLVVGAGFDPLAAMIAGAHPDVLSVEIDAPATSEPKRAGIEGAGLSRPNHHLVALDLAAHTLAEALATTPWRAGERSVVVAEGLLMYLEPDDVRRFTLAVAQCTGEGSRLAFSSMDADERGRPHLAVLDAPVRFALRLAGERLRWGIRPSDVPEFLRASGLRALAQPSADELRERYFDPLGLKDEPLIAYEHLVLAEVARESAGA
jgi:methyltransferase (TIGR00027 family)